MKYLVLIVDDDKALMQALSIRLQSEGFEVDCCCSANAASRVVVHRRPHVIVLDIDMPSYTGPEFHCCLKFTERAKNIPVVYLSGHDTATNRRIASEQGAVAFLTKPYDSDQLIHTLRTAVAATCRDLESL